MQSTAPTVQAYLQSLSADRRDALNAGRKVILANLDPLYEEGMQYGMILSAAPGLPERLSLRSQAAAALRRTGLPENYTPPEMLGQINFEIRTSGPPENVIATLRKSPVACGDTIADAIDAETQLSRNLH